MPVGALVLTVEGPRHGLEVRRAGGDGDREFVRLPRVAQVGQPFHRHRLRGEAIGDHRLPGLRLQAVEGRGHRVRVGAFGPNHDRLDELLLGIRIEQAQGAEHAGHRRHEHPADLQRAGDLHAEHGSVAAEGREHEVPRVPPAVRGDRLHGPGHGGAGEGEHPVRGFRQGAVQRPGHLLFEDGKRLRRVQGQAPADQVTRVQVADGDQRIGKRRIHSAQVVAHRTGYGPGALRAHARMAHAVDPADAAAPGPDLGDVDKGELDGIAAALDQLARQVDPATHLELGRLGRLAAFDHGRLGRRAAHVEGDQVVEPRAAGEAGAGHDPGGGTRFHHAGGFAPGRLDGHDAAARLHDVNRTVDAQRPKPVQQRLHVALDHGPDVGVHDGGARPLVLPDLRQDVGRAGDVEAVRKRLLQSVRDPPLVGRVRIGVEQAHRRRLHPLAPQFRDGRIQTGRIQRPTHGPVGTEALVDLPAQASGHERRRLLVLKVVHDRNAQPSHLEHVAEAPGRDEARPRALLLEDGVGGDGRGVDHRGDIAGRGSAVGESGGHALGDAAAVVLRRGRDLAGHHPPVVSQQDHIGEGAADVHADAGSHP